MRKKILIALLKAEEKKLHKSLEENKRQESMLSHYCNCYDDTVALRRATQSKILSIASKMNKVQDVIRDLRCGDTKTIFDDLTGMAIK